MEERDGCLCSTAKPSSCLLLVVNTPLGQCVKLASERQGKGKDLRY